MQIIRRQKKEVNRETSNHQNVRFTQNYSNSGVNYEKLFKSECTCPKPVLVFGVFLIVPPFYSHCSDQPPDSPA